MSTEFLKDDSKKPMVSLIQPEFILGMAKVMTIGAEKYSIDNWMLGNSQTDIRRYKDALLRHILAYTSGEKNDPETGLSHTYHAACNLMFLEYFDRQS